MHYINFFRAVFSVAEFSRKALNARALLKETFTEKFTGSRLVSLLHIQEVSDSDLDPKTSHSVILYDVPPLIQENGGIILFSSCLKLHKLFSYKNTMI
jgi:hypothetical protein